jgi:hypothetical protein
VKQQKSKSKQNKKTKLQNHRRARQNKTPQTCAVNIDDQERKRAH